jgi:AcrR family transcriptional regulator
VPSFDGSGVSGGSTSRREQLLTAGARLFAERGFHGVSIEELGSAVGISGPGLYKHFSSKDDVLSAMLIGISRHLLEDGRRRVNESSSPKDALIRLIQFHNEFSLTRPDLIRVHDRDLANLSPGEAGKVRRLQRAYVELWIGVLLRVDLEIGKTDARTKVHAVFGLLNSTPHSALARPREAVRLTLQQMAEASLGLSDGNR